MSAPKLLASSFTQFLMYLHKSMNTNVKCDQKKYRLLW